MLCARRRVAIARIDAARPASIIIMARKNQRKIMLNKYQAGLLYARKRACIARGPGGVMANLYSLLAACALSRRGARLC